MLNALKTEVEGRCPNKKMKRSFKIEGLCCANCAAKIESNINKLDGVDAVLSFMSQRLTIEAPDERFYAIVDEAQKIASRIESDCVIVR